MVEVRFAVENSCRCKPKDASAVRTGDRPFTEKSRHVAKLASGSHEIKTTVMAYVLCLNETLDATGLHANASSRVHRISNTSVHSLCSSKATVCNPDRKHCNAVLPGQSIN